jgi:hypothetical protein
MKSYPILIFFAAALVLVGCAMRSTLPALDQRHPASPDAPEAAIPEPATMLRTAPTPRDTSEQPLPAPHSGHHMHGGAAEEHR